MAYNPQYYGGNSVFQNPSGASHAQQTFNQSHTYNDYTNAAGIMNPNAAPMDYQALPRLNNPPLAPRSPHAPPAERRYWNGIPMMGGRTEVSMQHLHEASIENQCWLQYIDHPQFPPRFGLGYAKVIDTNDYLARVANNTLNVQKHSLSWALEGVQAQDAIVTLLYNFTFTKKDLKDKIKRLDPADALQHFYDLNKEFVWIRREPFETDWNTFINRYHDIVTCGFFKGNGHPVFADEKSNETSWRIKDCGQWLPLSTIDETGTLAAKHPEMVKFVGAEWGRHVLQCTKWVAAEGVKMDYWGKALPLGDLDVIRPLYRAHKKHQDELMATGKGKGVDKGKGKEKGKGKGKGKAVYTEDDDEEDDDEDALEMDFHNLMTDDTEPPSEGPQPSSPANPNEWIPSPDDSMGDDAADGDYQD